MAKIYLVVVKTDHVASSVVDTDHLPAGVNSDFVEHPWQQGADIMTYLQEDLGRTASCLDELASNNLSLEAKEFFSSIASLWENLPPPADGGAKDGIFACIDTGEKESHFLRTSPEVALKMYRDLRQIHRRNK
ncbi:MULTISPECIES: hypothetical protein [unclassified Caballeronia]|uniref:hypothetical protein n=1 Tax=unclassified Caballeronia TaxID=2646786 RepID=UPI001F1FBCC7|nr:MULTISPECIES: hypothetical protein [unclassified Caballeronia]MCE4546517.1 hypothetical protein [Caballeronia sp. PC1]MCE4573010.1 hypothetical protein [Caballeronia sp. CLC5]